MQVTPVHEYPDEIKFVKTQEVIKKKHIHKICEKYSL